MLGRYRLIAMCALLSVFISGPLHASWTTPLRDRMPPIELDLHVRHERTDLELGGEEFETEFTRLGMSVFDVTREWLQPGLQLGFLYGRQDDNPLMEDARLRGFYTGLSLRSRFFERRFLSFEARADYRFQQTTDSTSWSARLRWHEAQGSVGAGIHLHPLTVRGGVYALLIDGRETVRGAQSSSRHIQIADEAGLYAALDYWVDGAGRFSLRAEAGARESLGLEFVRKF
jgi:hypothetical protein